MKFTSHDSTPLISIAALFTLGAHPDAHDIPSTLSTVVVGTLNKKVEIIVVIISFFLTDLFIGIHQTILFTWGSVILIGIVSKKNSILYKASDIKLLIPEVKESAEIVPTSSTTSQLALGDALSIAAMKFKRFDKSDFKKIHPAGSLGAQLRTVEEIMLTGDKIPFVDEQINMKKALKILSKKKLGILIARDKKKNTTGIITDGQIRRFNQKNIDLLNLTVKDIMTKNPISIEKDALAVKAIALMNGKKITSLSVFNKKNKLKTIGVLHIHNILKSNIS